MEKLLVIDDSEEIRKQLKWGLAKEYQLVFAENAKEALSKFTKAEPKVVTLDLGLPPDADNATEGLKCLELILEQTPKTKVIVLTGNEDRSNALKAIQMGAYDYYSKPINLDDLRVILKRAFHLASLEDEVTRLHLDAAAMGQHYAGMIGHSSQMQTVFRTIEKVANYDAPVLVLGENGTGKELVAKAAHQMSLRKDGPFIAINCGAIPENLLEAELFGHEKGAFTGASQRVLGKVEYAQKGTLFLDEIGELPVSLQVKLLRFLQDKTIQRVGGREDIPVDVRIVAATNVNIQQAIKDGAFREDLFYRIGMVTIDLPPLRERKDDIPLLANFFMTTYSREVGKNLRGFSRASLQALQQNEWPGNIRELENRVKRAVIMAEGKLIEAEDLGFFASGDDESEMALYEGLGLREARQKLEFALVAHALEKEEGNVAKAAEVLGVSRPTLYDLMKKLGLSAASTEA